MAEAASHRYRVGVDVGGTFTDFVLSERATGRLAHHKEPSVPTDPSRAVTRGMQVLLAREGLDPGAIELVVHGTTLALNTTIQRRGAPVSLLVSRGNRDVLEIARCRMPNSYDFRAGKEEPLVPRGRVFEIGARLAADGAVLDTPEEADLAALAQRVRDAGVEALAVMLLNAPANAAFEQDIAARLATLLPEISVSSSTAIWPEIREYERAVATTLNASIHPLMSDYLSQLRSRLTEDGIKAPIYITASNGGTLSLATARARPIETMLSGPAAGVAAVTRVAREVVANGSRDLAGVLSFDMGGTSSDIALSLGGEPSYTNRTHVGDFPLMMPVVGISAIGAGGGSIVWTDAQGVLKVGPQSAGADPGPVCYGHGGAEPTVTDCYVCLGVLDPDQFLGGAQKLDRKAAEAALAEVGRRLGFGGKDGAMRGAEAALTVASANMASEMLKALAQNGVDPGQLALMPFGGAGPTHALLLAEEVGITNLVIPPAAGTFCAFGALIADVKRDFVRSLRRVVSGCDEDVIWQAFAALEAEALEWVSSEGDILDHHSLRHGADMRYAGQGFDLSVDLSDQVASAKDTEALIELFHREHEKHYGFRDLETAVEITTLRVRAVGQVPPIELPSIAPAAEEPTPVGSRPVWHQGAWRTVPVFRRDRLASGHKITGPAIIEQPDTTVWILDGWEVTTDTKGSLLAAKPGPSGADEANRS
ncbi:MAG: hydantoinase/oxoprolinase family protein [Alphaproteobacteria bacterium]|nr:hydantoinase/oxoprolinase family protein [Alphaproteobacteria bacterium]